MKGYVIVILLVIGLLLLIYWDEVSESVSRSTRKKKRTQDYYFNFDDFEISDEPPIRFTLPEDEEDDEYNGYFDSAHRHNGKMPILLLAPFRLYMPMIFTLSMLTILTASLLAR